MKTKNVLIAAVAALMATILYYSFTGGASDEDYIASVNKERQAKDEVMRGAKSPFGDEKKKFKNLNYFPPDLKYRISAKLVPIQNKKMIVLPTSDGKEERYLEYAFAEFELNNTPAKLLILEIADNSQNRGMLFLAFADSTSANETYGAGRYLDVKKIPGATSITLDFNQAYNPYCAYSDNFSCPFPPKENILKTSVRAGEKKYHD